MNASRVGWSCVWVGLAAAVGGCSGETQSASTDPVGTDGSSVTSNRPGSAVPDMPSTDPSAHPGASSTVGPTEGASGELIDEQPRDNTAGADAKCEREVEFEVIALGETTPFDVVIVADHSPSLTWSRDDLAAGLSNLIEQVHGGDVRFFVMTPTQYGEHSQAISMMGGDVVDWKDPVTGVPYPNDMTTYVETCSDLAGAPMSCPSYPPPTDLEFKLEGTFAFRMPEPVAAITRDMTLSELQAQQRAIADEILDLGVGGSPYEQPMCTLLRYVNQAPTELPQRAVFVVLTDEDDATSPMDCLSGVTYEQHFEPTWVGGCQSNCDGKRFTVQASYAEVTQTFTCMPYDDFGNALPAGAHEVTAYHNPVESCADVAVGDCSADQVTTVQAFCAAGERVEGCTMGCRPSEVQRPCWVDLQDVAIDACAESFTLGGVTYADVADYCQQTQQLTNWAGCASEGFTLEQGRDITNLTGSQCPLRFVQGTDPLSMASAFEARAAQAFGANNYFVEVIGLRPDFDCPLGTGQSYATNLMTLASSPEDVFPICKSYAPALGRIRSYATSSLETDYTLPLGELETLGAVYVSDLLGNERQLPADAYSHNFETATLTLSPTALASRDRTLRVELEVHCTPPVRQLQ